MTGPPRSNSQYHSANAITLVAQIDAPVAISGPAAVPAWPRRIARINSPADAALAIVISPISIMLAARTTFPRRSIRTGFAMLRPTSSAPSSTGKRMEGSGLV